MLILIQYYTIFSYLCPKVQDNRKSLLASPETKKILIISIFHNYERNNTMIFYFTSTGNCLSAAKRISRNTGDSITSITECIKNNQYHFSFTDSEKIGFIFPCYFWGTPLIFDDFIRHLNADDFKGHYIYLINTYGSLPGNTLGSAYKVFKSNNIEINSGFYVKMPENYMIAFKAPSNNKITLCLTKAYSLIDNIIKQVNGKVNNLHPDAKETIVLPLSRAIHKYYILNRRTYKFNVKGNCTGCGLCERICPSEVIKIKDNKPVWNGECQQCLGCLNRCPTSAIQYGKVTLKNGRYVHPDAFREVD